MLCVIKQFMLFFYKFFLQVLTFMTKNHHIVNENDAHCKFTNSQQRAKTSQKCLSFTEPLLQHIGKDMEIPRFQWKYPSLRRNILVP